MQLNNNKILFVTSLGLAEIGGPAKIFGWLLDKLKKNQLEYKIIELRHQTKVNNNKIVNSLIKINNFLLSLYKIFRTAKSYQIIFATDAVGAGLPGLIVAKILRKKFYVRVGGDQTWERYMEENDVMVDLKTFFEKKLFKKNIIIYLIVKIVLRSADKVMTPAQLLTDILTNYYEVDSKKISVINNFFNEKIESRQAQQVLKRKFIFVGRLINLKNIIFLSQCFVEAQIEDWQLLVVGSGYQQQQLEGIVNMANGQIVLMGQKTRQEMRDLIYDQVDCLLLPSISDIFPNTILEALASGLPCAISEYTGFGSDLKNSLYVFKSVTDKNIFINDLKNLTQLSTLNQLRDNMKNINWDDYSEEKIWQAYKKFLYE